LVGRVTPLRAVRKPNQRAEDCPPYRCALCTTVRDVSLRSTWQDWNWSVQCFNLLAM